jgi:hypothetical protein
MQVPQPGQPGVVLDEDLRDVSGHHRDLSGSGLKYAAVAEPPVDTAFLVPGTGDLEHVRIGIDGGHARATGCEHPR